MKEILLMPDLDIIRRSAERGLALALTDWPEIGPSDFIDIFQHILDELQRKY
jgi:hypothetical protein